MIFETIISTVNQAGEPHVTPFGVKYEGQGKDRHIIISPYKPSTTLDNILATNCAVMNMTDDVRVFAGALTGHTKWPLLPVSHIAGYRLADCLAHAVLQLLEVRDDETRPQLVMQAIYSENNQIFQGFNRAQAAVVELSILVSRLHLLSKEKVMSELAYLQIAIDKTAGARETEAWGWLMEKIDCFYEEQTDKKSSQHNF
jgi:uncharacterized protein